MEVDDLSLDECEAVDYADQMAIMSKISSNTASQIISVIVKVLADFLFNYIKFCQRTTLT